jgi:hypothetical protein
MGSAAKSDSSVFIDEVARTATVAGTITKNGPNARANMRVQICDCSEELTAMPYSDQCSV